jgi:hypothetical protein
MPLKHKNIDAIQIYVVTQVYGLDDSPVNCLYGLDKKCFISLIYFSAL